MEKWEYLTIKFEGKSKGKFTSTVAWEAEDFSEQINVYGQQGWELVFCFPISPYGANSGATEGVFAVFKRKIQS